MCAGQLKGGCHGTGSAAVNELVRSCSFAMLYIARKKPCERPWELGAFFGIFINGTSKTRGQILQPSKVPDLLTI
ncbi:hypothetical protein EXN24_25140 [Rhizobium rhizogenes]|jgi:hypothetical protein|uniref:Uncharacterized protein n=1 Tax=Rhizobium rhizogenes TaxID=359 RepID=A0AA95AG38_RHIRH|nr:hypothetical protein [Rhizobium rhizogenes]TRA84545.1 hypothetical protein EXN24_25140 [Rhizobium rhizogenes]